MDDNERLHLQKMISANNVEDCTQSIRDKKHSDLIRKDVNIMLKYIKKYKNTLIDNDQLDSTLTAECSFLFFNYTDIYNKVKKEEIDLEILWKFLDILKSIEDGNIDQHEGAFEVGNLLKKMYIDSALRKANNLDKEHGNSDSTPLKNPINISYSEFKKNQQ